MKCYSTRIHPWDVIFNHCGCDEIIQNYTKRAWNGELTKKRQLSQTVEDDECMTDNLEDIIHNIGVDAFKKVSMVDTLRKDLEDSLYPGCKGFTRLSVVLRLFNLKARCVWTDNSFTELLELLKEMLHEGNTLSNRTYEAKKILCPMSLDYVKIHACPNDFILYMKKFENLNVCPRCGVSYYK